jgi:hypothetical protein
MRGHPKSDPEVLMATLNSRFRRLVLAGSISVTAAFAPALPAPPAADHCPAIDPPVAAAPAAPAAGLRVFVDPVTGRIRRATPEERRRITLVSRDRSGRAYEVRTRPDGTRLVTLDETFSMSVVATANPDGTVSYRCEKDSATAETRTEAGQ